ncbi:hypothetical protein RI845_13435 [Thalassotalea nanhaiensis]|uniref:Uncharacterized protein n=1 Tax=Thalassotalea nanhaiensis TaxID=3065648 RepID=A0ABY9TFH3_9GAMM|nr:hypothetical protein RI845_13435 [Colwelliaceae bacterium SQ345]
MFFSQLSFSTSLPYLMVTIAVLLTSFFIVGYFLYQRFASKQELRFWLLLALNGIAALALFGLVSQPHWQTNEPQFATLITAGSGQMATDLTSPAFIFNDNQKPKKHTQWPLIYSTEQLSEHLPNLQKLQIVGHGLYPSQLQHISDIAIKFTPDDISPGLIDVSWNKQLILGEPLNFSARFRASNASAILTARILDLTGNTAAEMNILANESFQLTLQPKALGHYLYLIQIIDNNQQILTQQSIGVNVTKRVDTNIMIIQSAPSFESKQLANWISQYQSKVIVHTQISKNKFLSQRFNIAANVGISLSPKLLARQDLAIVDGTSLIAMSSLQRQWLSHAVDNGLGLLVLADTKLIEHLKTESLDIINDFSLTESAQSNSSIYPVWAQSQTIDNISEVALTRLPAALKVKQGKVLIADKQPLNVAKDKGLGVISMSILRERHRWFTQGELTTYSNYWQFLLTKISRSNNRDRFSTGVLTAPILATHKQQICVFAKQDITAQITQLSSQETRPIQLNKSLLVENHHCGVYWPPVGDWYKLTLNNASTTNAISHQYVHVAASSDWKTWQQYQKVRSTLQAVQNSKNNTPENSTLGAKLPINTSVFWWLFIISATMLWLEQKTRASIKQ